jgi:mRNA interferase MazF
MQRGEVWWASLPTPRGSGPGLRRPVVVVSADSFNTSAIRTVLVAAITSNERLAKAPGNVRLTRRQSGLPRISVVNVSQLLTLDKQFLAERVKALPSSVMLDVSAGLALVLGVSKSEA